MLEYCLIILADILFGITFSCNKVYQQRAGCQAVSGLSFSVQVGVFVSLFCLLANGFAVQITPYSLLIASAQAVTVLGYTMISFPLLKSGAVATYTMFIMAGGMTVPYVYGILFLDEPFSVLRTVGILLIVIGVVLSNNGIGKQHLAYWLMGIAVFLLNGFTSVLSKVHQIETVQPIVSTMDFLFLSSGLRAVLSAVLLLPFLFRNRSEHHAELKKSVGKSTVGIIVFTSALSMLSSFLLIRGAIRVPATVLYPVNTGGTIVFSAVIGRIIFKEKMTRRLIAGIVLCVLGTLLFL